MKIIDPSAELAQELDAAEIMRHLERAGRVCYKSESRISDTSAEKFLANIIKSGHESVIEHVSLTFKIICDRGVSHEIVRHRLASYCVTGDTVIPSYSKIYRNSGKKRTIETIYNWSKNPQCHAAFQQLVVRSFDEETHTVVPNKIRRVFYSGIQEVFELKTASGRIIKCTGGHRFFTDAGWKKLDELTAGNEIYVNGSPLLENEDWLRHNYLTLNKTHKQLAQEIGCCEALVYRAFKKFGIVKPLSDRPNRRPGRGVKGMFSAEQLKNLSERMSGEFNPAYKKNRAELTISGGYCEAHRKIGAFRDKIVSINYVGREKVYDLEMDEPYHNYVANGVIVHNSQMSTRYCDYSGDKFGGELSFIRPCFWQEGEENFELWRQAMAQAEKFYLELRKNGARPEEARSVLPNSLATELFMTANLREWRHFLKLRTSPRAHPQMRQIALQIYEILREKLPVIFSDIVI